MLNSVKNEGTTSAYIKLFLTNYIVNYLQKFRYLLELPQEFINIQHYRINTAELFWGFFA